MRHLFLMMCAWATLGIWLPMGLVSAQPADDFDARLHQARERLRQAIERETQAAGERLRRGIGAELERAAQGGETTHEAKPSWLGVTALAAPPDFLKRRNAEFGLLVTRIVAHGPASNAGMLADDLLVEFAGQPMKSRDDLRRALKKLKPGELVEAVVVRDQGRVKLTIMLGEAPEPTVEDDWKGRPAAQGGWIGLHVHKTDDGLVVIGTVADSPATKAGIRIGDVIVSIDGQSVGSAADLRDLFVARKIGDTMVFRVRRLNEIVVCRLVIERRPSVEYDVAPRPIPGMNLPEFPGRPDPAVARQLQQLNMQGCTLLEAGRYEEAIPYFERMLAVVPNNETALYNLACAYSLMGQLDKAVEFLERSFLAGFTDWNHVEKDPDLDPLRSHAGYLELMSKRDHFELVRARVKLDQIKELLGQHEIDISKYLFEIDETNKFIFATNRSREVLDHLVRDLVQYAEAQWKHLFIRRQRSYIAIVLPTEEDFRKMVPNRMIGGFYNPAAEALIAPAMDHTLTHEFTHALHFADTLQIQQAHSIWYLEGLATCFESSRLAPVELEDGTIDLVPTPMPNERLPGLQEAIANGATIPLRTMLSMNQAAFMSQAALCYAQSRYLCVWIWEQGKLKELHAAYCDTWQQDPTGITAVERVMGKPLEELEKEWIEWVRHLPPFQGHTGAGGAYLAIQMEEGGDGIRLSHVQPDGPAWKGGLRDGDVIRAINGRRIVSLTAFIEEMGNRKPGDKIVVTIIRDGAEQQLTVELGARPSPHEHR